MLKYMRNRHTKPHDITYNRTQNRQDLKFSNNAINKLVNEIARLSKGEVQ